MTRLPTSAETPRDFFTVGRELNLLSDEASRELFEECTRRNSHPGQLAMQKGLLSAVQIDIIETMLRPHDVAPGYEVLEVLGHGGMGIVYRALQTNLQRPVALKTILLSQMSSPSIAKRFEQEAKTLARLRHPNIVAAHDCGRHEGRLYFAMELVEGENLEDHIAHLGCLSEPVAWALARQVAAGLSHAAQEGVVHRDIKPANILLLEPPIGFPFPSGIPLAKITDFGLALFTDEADARTRLTSNNAALGSPLYMAPEQLNNSTVDLRADIYSLGVTMFQMLTGKAPFRGSLSHIVAAKLSGRVPELPDTISSQTADLVLAMLTTDPEQRVQDYPELIRRIDVIHPPLGEIPELSVGNRTLPRSHSTGFARPARRMWLKRAAVIAMALLLVGLAALFLARPDHPGSPDLIAGSWAAYLFNGRDTSGWQLGSGSWSDARDEEETPVLSGTQGVIRHRVVKELDGNTQPVEHYRVQTQVRLHEAEAVELQFEILATNQVDAPRLALRLTQQGAMLVRRQTDRGPIVPLDDATALNVTPSTTHVLRVERQRTHWWAYANDKLVGHTRIAAAPQLPEIRLAVEGGPAWFNDIEVMELIRPREP